MGKILKEEDLKLNIIVNGNESRKKIGELTRSVHDLKSENDKLQDQRRKLASAGKKESQQYRDLTAQIDKNKKTIKAYSHEVKDLTAKIKVSDMTMAELHSRAKQLSAQLRNAAPGTTQYAQLSKQLKEVNLRFAELKTQTKGVAGVTDKLGLGNLQSFIGKLFIYYNVLLGFFRIFSGGINKIKEFEQANVNLSTILGVSLAQMTALTKSALELGRTTEYTASQVTNLQTELAKLGFGEHAIMQMQTSILRFATAMGAELPEAAALAGATLRAFDLSVMDTEEMLATMAVGANKSALSFVYLNEAMSIVAPVAKTFGFGIKDTVALLGTLANSGFDASSAATATRNILLNLADANGKLAKELGKPVRTLPELINGLKQLDANGINLSKTLELTDKRSVAAFNTFLRGADAMGILRDSVENVDGELKRIAEERLKTVEGGIKIMQSAWEGFILTFYESKGKIKSVVDLITSGIVGLTDLMNPDGVAERLSTQFVETLMKTYSDRGEVALKKEISSGLKYWEDKYNAADKRYSESAGLVGKGDYHRSKNLYNAFISAGDTAMNNVDKLKVEDGTRAEKEADEKKRAEVQKRQEAAAAAYASLTDKEMSERIAIKKKYLTGEIAVEEDFNAQLLQLSINALKRRLKSGELKGQERLTAEEQLTTLLLQQRKEESDKLEKIETERIKSISDATMRENAEYAQRRRKYQGNSEMLLQIDAQHSRNINKIQLDKINTAIKADEDGHKRLIINLKNQQASELLAFTGSAADKKKLRKEHQEEMMNLDAKYAVDMAKRLQELLDNGNFEGLSLNDAILSDEEKAKLEQKILELKEKLASLGIEMKNLTGGEFNPVEGTKDLLGFSLADWEALFEHLKDGKVGIQEIAMVMKSMTAVYATYDKFASASEARLLKQFKKSNDAKKKDLDRRLDLGLISQDQYNTRCEQLDEEYAAKEEEIQIKQARRQKAMSIIDAIINTAVGITASLAMGGIIGPILAAMVGAMGAVQIALIASQPIGGAEEGGMLVTRAQDGKKFNAKIDPRRRGYIDKPTVITGENGLEYVIPNEAMDNPTARPIIDLFETVRKQGRLADFDFEQIIPALYAMPGRAAGGSIKQQSDVAGGSLPFIESGDDAKRIIELLEYLCSRADQPLPAEVSLLGRRGFIEQLDKYDRLKRNGQLG